MSTRDLFLHASLFERIRKALAFIVIVTGFLALLGWVLDFPVLTRISATWPTMKLNTAICFIFSGISLFLLEQKSSMNGRLFGRVCSLSVLIIGLLTVYEYLGKVSLGIDEMFFKVPSRYLDVAVPGRMSLATAISFSLLGISFIGIDWKISEKLRLPYFFSVLVLLMGFLTFSGYLFGSHAENAFPPFASVAFHTSILFMMLSIGILCINPQEGPFKVLMGDGIGSVLVRRLISVCIAFPLILGWLTLKGQQQGLYGLEFGLATFAASNVLALIILISLTSQWLNQMESLCPSCVSKEVDDRDSNSSSGH